MTHVSTLTLDALALDALDAAGQAAVRAHLESCAACRAEQTAAAELRDHFSRHVLPRTRPTAQRRSWRWTWLAVPVLAVAAVMLLVVTRTRGGARDELGIKGDAAWQVFANRNDQTFAVHDGTTLAAGDRIRFVITPNGAAYVLVASVDGAGAATIYYPYGGSQSAPTEGPRTELPGSIVLDTAPGPERIYAIFSDDPIAADVVASQLRAIGAGGADAIRDARMLQIPARAQLSLVFEKAAP